MTTPSPRSQQLFFEVFEGLPRQGPGNRASAERALALCGPLPAQPAVLDLGCGLGAQTLYLADMLPDSHILALDNHGPFIPRLNTRLAERRIDDRARAVLGDMAHPDLPPASFDLIWSEGALYSIGLEAALRVCHGLLHPGGQLVFTESVWRVDDPPPEVRIIYDAEYPTMGRVGDVLTMLARCGFEPLDHFPLPDEAWWNNFYTPMDARIAQLRQRYANDTEACAALDQIAEEPRLHHQYGHCYGYEYFIARKT